MNKSNQQHDDLFKVQDEAIIRSLIRDNKLLLTKLGQNESYIQELELKLLKYE